MQQQDAAMCSGLPKWQEQFLQRQTDGFWSPPLSVYFDHRCISWSKYGPDSLFSAPEMSTNLASICIWSTMPVRLFWSRGQLHLSFAYVKQGAYCKLETHVSGRPAVCQHHHAMSVRTDWRLSETFVMHDACMQELQIVTLPSCNSTSIREIPPPAWMGQPPLCTMKGEHQFSEWKQCGRKEEPSFQAFKRLSRMYNMFELSRMKCWKLKEGNRSL